MAASDFESFSTSFASAAGFAGAGTAALATLPLAALDDSARGGMEDTPPASCSRYAFQSATCTRISLLASLSAILFASSDLGTLRIWPAFRRFMLLPEKALRFSRYRATSICSMLTPSGFTSPAILRSVSPFWTGP